MKPWNSIKLRGGGCDASSGYFWEHYYVIEAEPGRCLYQRAYDTNRIIIEWRDGVYRYMLDGEVQFKFTKSKFDDSWFFEKRDDDGYYQCWVIYELEEYAST